MTEAAAGNRTRLRRLAVLIFVCFVDAIGCGKQIKRSCSHHASAQVPAAPAASISSHSMIRRPVPLVRTLSRMP